MGKIAGIAFLFSIVAVFSARAQTFAEDSVQPEELRRNLKLGEEKDIIPKYPTSCELEWVDAEDPFFLLYISGSTGKPKGVLHTPGGYMIYTATTFKFAFDYKPSDVYWCTADCEEGERSPRGTWMEYNRISEGSSVILVFGCQVKKLLVESGTRAASMFE